MDVLSLILSAIPSNENIYFNIEDLGGVANDVNFDNAAIINAASAANQGVRIPANKTFYCSTSIKYSGQLNMIGDDVDTSIIMLAPNTNQYLLMPLTVNNTTPEYLHETVNLTNVTFDANKDNGNDTRNEATPWNTSYFGFGLTFANTRNVTLRNIKVRNSEAWNIAYWGVETMDCDGYVVEYDGTPNVNSDGITGHAKYVYVRNVTADHLDDDVVGVTTGTSTLTADVGINYDTDIEEIIIDNINVTSDSHAPIGVYPTDGKKVKKVTISNFDLRQSKACIRIYDYFSSVATASVDEIIIENGTRRASRFNSTAAIEIGLLTVGICTIRNVDIISPSNAANTQKIIEDNANITTLIIDDVDTNTPTGSKLYNSLNGASGDVTIQNCDLLVVNANNELHQNTANKNVTLINNNENQS